MSLNIKSFTISSLDKKARKLFPLRLSNFYTDISLIEKDIGWQPNFSLDEGFADSFKNDYSLGITRELDFSMDQKLFIS